MEAILQQVIPLVAPAAWPLIIVILGCAFIYFKIGRDRKQTKTERDTAHDDLDKRLTLVEHDVQFMKQQNALFADKLDRILDELCSIKIELAKKEEKK